MSLNWDMTKVKDHKKLDGTMNNTVIFGTMFVGISLITEANKAKFFARISLFEKVNGTMYTKDGGKPVYTTPKDINDRVGLQTNASTLSDVKFHKKIVGELEKQFVQDLKS